MEYLWNIAGILTEYTWNNDNLWMEYGSNVGGTKMFGWIRMDMHEYMRGWIRMDMEAYGYVWMNVNRYGWM